MQALVLEDQEDLAVMDVPEPTAAVDEVVLRVRSSAVCGTDVHGYAEGPPLRQPPIVMGHEFCGTVDGDDGLCVVNPRVVCGACDHCVAGAENRCQQATTLGVQRAGGFAEAVSVPARNCVPVPADLDWRVAALTEPLAVGLHGANVIASHTELAGQRVGVVGGGVVGLGTAIVAQRRGAEVTLADFSADRQAQARRHGIADVRERLEGTYPVTVEAAGSAGAREASLAHSAPGGFALWIGLDSAPAAVDLIALVRAERSILTSYCYTEAEFKQAVELCREFETDELEIVPIEDGPSVFDRLRHGPASASQARTVFVFGDAQ